MPKLLSDKWWDRLQRLWHAYENSELGGLPNETVPVAQQADGIVALTPAGGIAGRSTLTITGVQCNLYRIDPTGDPTSGTLTLEATGETAWVYNTLNTAVTGGVYVDTALLKAGVRRVIAEDC